MARSKPTKPARKSPARKRAKKSVKRPAPKKPYRAKISWQARAKQRARLRSYRAKRRLYFRLRDDFIREEKRKGITIGKAQAMQSDKLKKIVRDLKSRDPKKKAQALAESGRITKDEIVLYVEKFSEA